MSPGNTGEWNTFTFQFKKAALHYGCGQQEKCDRLLASLRGKVVDFIMNSLILKGYLHQQEGESLGDYADKVCIKVTEAYHGADEE